MGNGLSKLIREIGYEVITLTQKPFHIDGTITNVWEEPLDVVANYLYHAKAFIGLGSGLSWFNWALGNHTYMINGFAKTRIMSSPQTCTKIYNDNTCAYSVGMMRYLFLMVEIGIGVQFIKEQKNNIFAKDQ